MLEDKLDNNFKKIIAKSFHLAKITSCQHVLPAHILLAMLKQKGTLANEILKNKSLENKILNLLAQYKSKQPIRKMPQLSLSSEQIILRAVKTAYELKHPFVGTEHLFYSIISGQTDDLKNILDKNINKKQIKHHITARFKGTSRFPEIRDMFNFFPSDNLAEVPLMEFDNKTGLLSYFSTDLTDSKNQSNFMPLIGREKEISQLIQILCRKNKNNPLLLGEPGVGKTALVEGLAQKIVSGQVPEILFDKKIIALDIGSLVAGTMYRGDFEARVKQILEEIKDDPNIILFIDEIHNITGAGSASGSLDAANLFKPLLARGELKCIGATTDQEYKKSFTRDAALARRFQALHLSEPTKQETIEILQGLKSCYENFHQIQINDQALITAIDLSNQYVPERFQPDKSLDLIDEASARLRINNKKINEKLKKIKAIEKQLSSLEHQKEKAILGEKYHQAINIRDQIHSIKKQLKEIQNRQLNLSDYPQLGPENIQQILAQKLDLDLTQINLSGTGNLTDLAERIQQKVIGQNQAITQITQILKRAYTGLQTNKRPLGSFIFTGSSGVGKTYLAEILTQEIFAGKNNLIRLDMSEFTEQFNASKLIGAPAGYVGYQEENKFTDQVKKKPHSIILLDEIEKAHSNIFNLLLQILDNGQITDAAGQLISFRQTIIIMTSNLGNKGDQKSLGFGADGKQEDQKQILSEVKKFFSPEFINRLDEILVFNNLGLKNLEKIAIIELDKIKTQLKDLKKELIISPQISKHLAKQCCLTSTNARNLLKLLEEKIIGPISEILIKNPSKNQIAIDVQNRKINIK